MALIYIVEDDASIREVETIALANGNYDVVSFENASSFYKQLEKEIPNLVLLDVMLPDENGFDIVKKLRNQKSTHRIPIIMVTAKSTEMDMVKGLNEGADDYIRKPFSIMELLSRIKALLRRTMEVDDNILEIRRIRLDNNRHIVKVNNEEVELTFKEFELLKYLMVNADVVLSRESIMRKVWDTDFEGESRTVDMHIKTLRQKLGEAGKSIKTIRNVGYVIQKMDE